MDTENSETGLAKEQAHYKNISVTVDSKFYF